MSQDTFWMYRVDYVPTLQEAIALKAIAEDTTPVQWFQLSPGYRREIVCSARKGK